MPASGRIYMNIVNKISAMLINNNKTLKSPLFMKFIILIIRLNILIVILAKNVKWILLILFVEKNNII